MTKDVAQRSPSALLRAMSLSNGRWTFYEAVNLYSNKQGEEPREGSEIWIGKNMSRI